MSRREPRELSDVTCVHSTDDALLCDIEGEEIWIPRSQVLEDSEVQDKGDTGTLVITAWIAEQKGLQE